jgi:predicted DNA-binding transcriptional regulator AlpA
VNVGPDRTAAALAETPSSRSPQSPGSRTGQISTALSSDKLTVDDICADLNVSRRTFYEWRAKGKAPRCLTLPNGSLRVRRSDYQRWLASREEAA